MLDMSGSSCGSHEVMIVLSVDVFVLCCSCVCTLEQASAVSTGGRAHGQTFAIYAEIDAGNATHGHICTDDIL